MDKVKILRIPNQGGFRDLQIGANANNIDTNDGNNVQTALDNLNDRLDNDINNRFIQNEESIQNLGKDKTAIFDSIDRLEAQIEDIDALFPSEAITAIIENASASQIQAIQYAGNQQLSNITNSGLGQVSNIQNKGASQLSAFEAAAADLADQQIGLIEDAGQAQINSFNTDAAAAAQNQIASINSAGSTQVTNINDAGTTQTGNVNSAGTTQTANVNNAGSIQVTNINDAGSAKIASINSAGAARLAQIEQAIQSKAEQALADIPDDYTELGQQVNDLKDFVDKIQEIGVASAGQLISDNYIEDKIPYLYRQSGGNGADREFDTIVGGSVVWNQLADHDNPYAFNTSYISFDENTHIYTATYPEGSTYSSDVLSFSADDFIDGHVYYNNFKIIDDSNYVAMRFYFPGGTTSATNIDVLRNYSNAGGLVWRSTLTRFRLNKSSGTTSAQSISFKYQYFDLTRMFGATIADYIYSLEQTTLGSGIAKLKSWGFFTKDYYAYNAGELLSVNAASHDMVGFNQWDEEWEVGMINTSTGAKETYANGIRSKNYIPIIGNAVYYFKCPSVSGLYGRVFWYDADKNFITYHNAVYNTKRTAPQNACYALFSMTNAYGTTYKNDICLNLSWDGERDGEYEAYQKRSYPLDDSLTLRGIPKLDADNNLYYDGDEYASDGSVKRKYGEYTITGNEEWHYFSNQDYFYCTIDIGAKRHKMTSLDNALMTNYKEVGFFNANTPDKSFVLNSISHSSNNFYIKDTSFGSDVNAFKTEITGKRIVYLLKNPTSETAESYINPQTVDPEGTEEYVTTSIVPVGHITKYPENIKAKIDGLPWDLSMIAPIDNGTTAIRAYSTGQYFMHNNQFCKAKTAIASGATFTLNTNYEVTTVAAELYSALN